MNLKNRAIEKMHLPVSKIVKEETLTMAYYKRSFNKDGQSAESKALDKFAEQIIKKNQRLVSIRVNLTWYGRFNSYS